jgi:hypothetical protein
MDPEEPIDRVDAAPPPTGTRPSVAGVIAFVAGAAVAVLVWAMKDTLEESHQPQFLVLAVGAMGWAGTQLRRVGQAFWSGDPARLGVDERRKTSPVVIGLALMLFGPMLAAASWLLVNSLSPSASLRRFVASAAFFAFSAAVVAALARELKRRP